MNWLVVCSVARLLDCSIARLLACSPVTITDHCQWVDNPRPLSSQPKFSRPVPARRGHGTRNMERATRFTSRSPLLVVLLLASGVPPDSSMRAQSAPGLFRLVSNRTSPPPVLLFLFPFPFPLLSFSPSFSFSSLFLFSSALRCTRNGDARLSKKQLELYFSFSLFRLFFLFPPHAPRLERNKSCRCYVRRRREKGHMSNNGLVAQRRTEKWESIKVMRIFLRTIADRVRISRFAFARILTGTSSRAPSTLYRIG